MSNIGMMVPNEKPEHPYIFESYVGKLLGNYSTRFCAGCGYGIVAQIYTRIFKDMNLDPFKYPLVVGIGCYAQIMLLVHFKAQKILALHGRAPAVATGIKMANPSMKPIIFSGDGDSLGIGGNHFMHMCRRNIDVVELVFNNSIYAMTGGQGAPTTLYGAKTSTTPYKMFENKADTVKIALAAGATYVARTTVAHPRTFMKYFKKALAHKGTSVIEIVTPCVTYFGRKNLDNITDPEAEGKKMDTGGKMIDWIRSNTIRLNQANMLSDKEIFNKYVIEEFRHDTSQPE